MKKKILFSLFLTLTIFTTAIVGCSSTTDSSSKSVTIGSKEFSESLILAEMFAQLIEADTDIKVNRKFSMGGTFVCFEALKNGEIDLYPEYTGTALTAQLNMDVIHDAEETYAVVKDEFDKQFGITWLDPVGINNTYAIAVTKAVANEYNLVKCSDLSAVSENLVFGTNHEFFNRQDGFEGFIEKYDITFKGDPKQMNVSLKFQAIGSGEMDVTNVFATDAETKKFDLVVLEDDLNFFPPYYAAPIVLNDTLEKYPELVGILNKLSNEITDEEMISLNYRVNIDQEEIGVVVRDYLIEKGLISE